MRNEVSELAAVFNLGFAAFHLLFARLFNWRDDLAGLMPLNRALVPVLNLALTFLLALAGVLILFATPAQALLGGMALFWLFRAALQPFYFGLRHQASAVLFAVFLGGALLHGAAWQANRPTAPVGEGTGWSFGGNGLDYQAAGGTGDKVLVFVHGAGLDARLWDCELMRFSRSYRMDRYDVRGFGLSQRASHPSSHVSDLLELIDEFGHAAVSLVDAAPGTLAQLLSARAGAATLHVISNAGHVVNVDAGEAFVREVTDFLAS